tara:strand:+ start:7424 stop:8575 length:1152 start_codon:yes stop_codon:yes gene_type:complete
MNLGGFFSKKWLWAVLALIVVAIIFFSFTGKVVVEVTPRTETQAIDLEFTLSDISSLSANPVVQVVSASGSMEKDVRAQGVKDIERKASGKIVIFNDNGSTQRLIARTRFEAPNGLVYRISDAVTVPAGTNSGPGSLEVTVQADEPGDNYNIDFVDFTVPGLKGTPLFDAVYARSKTPMTGGFSGLTKEVKKEDEDAARSELENALTGSLKEEALEGLPEGYILLDDAIFINFTESREEDVSKEDEPVTFIVSGELEGIALHQDSLDAYIAGEALSGVDSGIVSVGNLADLSFSLQNKNEIDFNDPGDAQVTISGEAVFVWDIDKMAVQSALSGLPKDEITYQRMFIEEFPDIIQAQVTQFDPFWARRFPSNSEKIEIVEVLK